MSSTLSFGAADSGSAAPTLVTTKNAATSRHACARAESTTRRTLFDGLFRTFGAIDRRRASPHPERAFQKVELLFRNRLETTEHAIARPRRRAEASAVEPPKRIEIANLRVVQGHLQCEIRAQTCTPVVQLIQPILAAATDEHD